MPQGQSMMEDVVASLINEQRATTIVEHLSYDTHDVPEIFTKRKEDLIKGFKTD